MKPIRSTIHLRSAAVILSAASLALAGCGGSAASSSTPSTSISADANSAAAALLPADVKQRGYITVVTDVTYPPFGFLEKDGKTFVGIDVDTARALQPLLGVEVKVVKASFDAFIPGLQANRYDAGFNAISDTAERRKTVDFINFNRYGALFLTRPDSPAKFTDMMVACGVKVGAEKGGDTIEFLATVSKQCGASGKPPVDVVVFGSQADSLVALASGRVDAVLGPSTSGYLADRSAGKYVVNGPLQPTVDGGYDVGGLALQKKSPIGPAMLAAMKQLYEDGSLAKIYAKYGISAEELTPPVASTS